ncbi:MAG: hypothetical protein U0271_00530 [Polyangiaceae bacterium]
MKRSILALALIVVGALTGCGDQNQAGASAETQKSAASNQAKGAASSAAAPAGKPAADAKDKAAEKTDTKDTPKDPPKPDTAAAAAPGTTAPAGDILRYMPKECDEGRGYGNVSKLSAGDIGTALDGAMTNLMSLNPKDSKKAEEAMKVLRDGGIEPGQALDEIAVCANKDDKKTIVAFMGDMSKSDKPAETIAKAIETASGKTVKREEAGDITWLMNPDGKDVIAVIGKTTLLMGKDKAALEAAAKGLDGAGEFGDAKNHVVWVSANGKEPMSLTVDESGDNFALKANVKAGEKKAADAKKEFDKMLPELDKNVPPLFKPVIPVVKSAKVEAAGDTLNISADIPKATIVEFLNGLKTAKVEDLKGLRF